MVLRDSEDSEIIGLWDCEIVGLWDNETVDIV